MPSAIRGHAVNYETLVCHRESVQAEDSVAAVYKHFQSHDHEYVAVLRGKRFVGLVSRGHIGFLLSGRYGFAIYERQPVGNHLLERHLSLATDTPLLGLLDQAFSRQGENFYDDVVLLGTEEQMLGIIPMQSLVRLQTQVIADATRQVEAQRSTLAERNLALTRSLDELRQSRSRYDVLFQNSVLGVALLDRRYEVKSHNRQFAALLGLTPENGAEPLNLCNLVVPSERQSLLLLLRVQEDDGEEDARPAMSHSGEFRLQLPRHGVRQFKIIVSWVPETSQVCVLLDDVSEQRTMERRLAQKEKSQLLESLVGGIAHELNNKLTPILMLSELAIADSKAGGDQAEVVKHCQAILSSATEAARIIRQLLQLSKPTKMELGRCDLRVVVEDVLTLLNHRLRQDSVTREVLVPPGGAFVLADSQQLKQVLINLLLNSLDAMEKAPKRAVKILISRENGHFFLCIADTGSGIAPEAMARIFDPFFTTKDPDRGTGLGLSVCLSIVKQHGGEITVGSVSGQGTEFTVRLPAYDVVEVTPPAPKGGSKPAVLPPVPLMAGHPKRRRVLIVDDDEAVAGMLQNLVRRQLACDVECVSDGQCAIECLQQGSFDLVISDVRMPRVNGLRLLCWIREHQPEIAGRFFFITGDAGSIDLNEEIESVGVPVLRKPFPMEVLLTQCRLLIRS